LIDRSGREGWSDRSLWYNYRIRGLVETGNPNEAIVLVDEISERYPKQRKFFLRLKARSYLLLNNLTEAEQFTKIYVVYLNPIGGCFMSIPK